MDSWAEVATGANVTVWVMNKVIWLPSSWGLVVLFHLLALGSRFLLNVLDNSDSGSVADKGDDSDGDERFHFY